MKFQLSNIFFFESGIFSPILLSQEIDEGFFLTWNSNNRKPVVWMKSTILRGLRALLILVWHATKIQCSRGEARSTVRTSHESLLVIFPYHRQIPLAFLLWKNIEIIIYGIFLFDEMCKPSLCLWIIAIAWDA